MAAYARHMPTALLSVYDKTGIVELAAGLHAAGWRIVSSGGTARAVAAAGVPVTDLAELTGLPAILDHRVVTLHPKVHGGLLADPTKPEHLADMAEHGIEPIDLLVVNLYPFDSDPSIELIDIGVRRWSARRRRTMPTSASWSTPPTTRPCSTRSGWRAR